MKILMNYFYPAVLVLICLLLIFINHVPSSYLSGWDTLHPEFNFPLNFQRLIFGVFRDNQGLGAVAAHAHMSDLPRVFFIFFLSSVLPNNLLRFFYIAICLPIGSLGVYFFCKIILLPHSEKKIKEAAAFLAALFYLLNLGTLQHFYVPFEMFNTQYAFLPWLFLTVTNYLKNPSRKNLLFFSLVSLFSTPMAYASTLWYAYFLSLILYLIVFLKKYLRSCLVIIFLTLILNSFWILPNIYFLASGNASNVPNARTNLLFSEEAFAYNKSFGDIKDTLIFKNFLFEWSAYKDNKFEYLLANWRNYLNKPFIAEIGYVMAFISLLGLVYSITKKQQIGVGLIGPTLLSFIFLTNQNPPFDEFFLFLRDHSNLFKEALRFPFTKFSIILMFSFSCYFAYGQKFIFSIFNKIRLKFLIFLVVFITSASLVFYMWPAFRGDLISKLIQVQIPNEYFQMFNWFNNQSLDGRIANLPIHSLWGWTYYDWGFQGSGFLSSGLKQPLLDRDFDRWNPSNEEYYREMSYAIYSTNINLVEKVLSKYQIKYIILDDNVIAPGINVGRGILFTNQIKSLFDQSTKIRLVKKFGNIEIYQADLDKSYQGFFYSPVNLTSISGNFGFKDLDYEYLQSGDYINNLNNPSIKNLVFPFTSILDNQNFLKDDLISLKDNQIILNPKNLPQNVSLATQDYLDSEIQVPAIFSTKTTDKTTGVISLNLPYVNVSDKLNKTIEFPIPFSDSNQVFVNVNNQQTFIVTKNQSNFFIQNPVFLSTKSINDFTFYSKFESQLLDLKNNLKDIGICGKETSDQLFNIELTNENSFKISSKNSQVCLKIPLKNLISKDKLTAFETLARLKFLIPSGSNLAGHYCIYDTSLNRCIKEEKNLSSQNIITSYFTLDSSLVDNLVLIFYADNFDNQLRFLSYQDIELSISSPSGSYSVFPQDLYKLLSNQTLNFNKNDQLKIDSNIQQLDLFKEGHFPNTCSDILPKFFDRKVNLSLRFIEYTSEGGSSCDSFSIPTLSHNLSYLLDLEVQNITGLPMRVCVSNNTTKRCDLYLDLKASNEFTHQILVLPPAEDGGFGFDIDFDNISIGNDSSVNRLRSLKIIPFPYYWISEMSFTDKNDYRVEQLAINNQKQILPGLYSLNLSKTSSKPSLLVFNQAFGKGWIAIFGQHVLVNSFANGWLIDSKLNRATELIFYLPNLLEVLGFIFLVFTFISLIWKLKKGAAN